jgi:hypothetical protein
MLRARTWPSMADGVRGEHGPLFLAWPAPSIALSEFVLIE